METRVALLVASLLCVCLATHSDNHGSVTPSDDLGSGSSLLMPDLSTEELEATTSEILSSSSASLSIISPTPLSPLTPFSSLMDAISYASISATLLAGSPVSSTLASHTLTSSPTPSSASSPNSSVSPTTSPSSVSPPILSLSVLSTALPSSVSPTTSSSSVSPTTSTLLMSFTPSRISSETSSVSFSESSSVPVLFSSSGSILPSTTQSPVNSQSLLSSSESSSVPVLVSPSQSISPLTARPPLPANSRSLFPTRSQSFSSSSQFLLSNSRSLSLRPPIPTPSPSGVIMVQIELRLTRPFQYTNATAVISDLREQFSAKLNISTELVTSVSLLLDGEVQDSQRLTKRDSHKEFNSVQFEVTTETTETANAVKEVVSQQKDSLSISLGNETLTFTVSIITPAKSTLPSSSSTQMPTDPTSGSNNTGVIAIVIICVLLVVLILVVMVIVLGLYIYKKTHTRSYKFDVPLDDIATTPVWKSDIPPCDDESTIDIDAKCADDKSVDDKSNNQDW